MSDQPKPPQTAVALEYDGENAPRVSATGRHEIAEEIIRIAKENDVPLYENAELVSLLATLELGDEIPEVLYLAIAQIIAFVYHLQGKLPDDFAVYEEPRPQPTSESTELVIDTHQFIQGDNNEL